MASFHKIARRTILAMGILAGMCSVASFAAEAPWRLNNAIELPDGFNLSGTHRTRFENLTESVRPGTSSNDQVLVLRTILNADYQDDAFSAQLELMDSRQELASRDSIIGTDVVNSLDILQANVNWALDRSQTRIKLGRFTADWGSRRLLARNRFRNTINAFDGVEIQQSISTDSQLRVMASQPVQRLPGDRPSLLKNTHEWDDSSPGLRLYSAQLTSRDLLPSVTAEFYIHALREQDTTSLNTRDRRLNSSGLRLYSAPALDQFDFELEGILQRGEQRATTTSSDRQSQDHNAHFLYAMLGYSFDLPSRLRILFEFDYASGDENPFDQDSERFDSLFGTTTFEFGVGGLYGVFSRSNLITPGIRLTGNANDRVNLMLSYRHYWLAEKRDSWGRTGLRDVSGSSGSYLGQHLETRLRWDVVPGNVRLEGGFILLRAKNLSNNHLDYVYGGVNFTF